MSDSQTYDSLYLMKRAKGWEWGGFNKDTDDYQQCSTYGQCSLDVVMNDIFHDKCGHLEAFGLDRNELTIKFMYLKSQDHKPKVVR